MNKNKLKICFMMGAHPKVTPGGAELQLYQIAKLMVQQGNSVYIVTDSLNYNPGLYKWKEEGIELYKLKTSHIFLKYYLAPMFLFKKINASVYVSRGLFYSFAVSLFARLYKKKSVYMVAHINDCRCFMVLSLFKKLSEFNIKHCFITYINQYGMRIADTVVAQSVNQKHFLMKNFGLKSVIIKSGLPVIVKPSQKVNPPVVLWLASLKRWKQAEIFIQLARHCQNLNCKFILAGRPTDKGYLKKIHSMLKGLSNIEYIGEINVEKSTELIGGASLFVNTSKYEGFPNTFIQAWMRQIPTVSLNVDPDDVIKKNKLGFHSKSFEQLVRDVKFLIINRSAREEMGKNARRYAIRNHDINKIMPEYIELFDRLIKTE